MDLSSFPEEAGICFISPPQQFEGGEEAYDAHIGGAHRADQFRSGRGAWHLITHYAQRPLNTVLELGAGGGTCSLGLMDAARGTTLIVTDTSPQFLRLIQRKCSAAGLDTARVQYATLAGEDLARLAAESLDALVIASALHHVGDWRGFLREAAAALRPGGVLAIQEPFREGNLMMAMAIDVALSPLWPAAAAFSREDRSRLDACRSSIYFLANSGVEKVGEDKHNFLATELTAVAGDAGFSRVYLHSNAHFEDLAGQDLAAQRGRCSIVGYLASFLRDHHRISPDGMAKLGAHLFPILGRLDETYMHGDGPPLLGCMVFRK